MLKPLRPLVRLAGDFACPGQHHGKLTILTYHRVLARPDPLLPHDQIDVPTFATHMQMLADHFRVLPLSEAMEMLQEGRLPSRSVAITFDDGYADNQTEALPILKHHGMSATFYVCTGYLGQGLMFNDIVNEAIRATAASSVDLSELGLGTLHLHDLTARCQSAARLVRHIKYLPATQRDEACLVLREKLVSGATLPTLMMSPEQLASLARDGMEVGGHTHTHPILRRISLDAAREDIQRNLDAVKAITGKSPITFAYPNGLPDVDYDTRHTTLLRELGIHTAVSCATGVAHTESDFLQLPRFAPWGNDGRRFVYRVMRNALTGTQALNATQGAPDGI